MKKIFTVQRIIAWKVLSVLTGVFSIVGNICAQDVGKSYDVVVYGASPAGITAAIAAARENRTVILLEPASYIGGIMSDGLCGTDIDNHGGFTNHTAVGGLALEFYKRVAKRYGWLDSLNIAIEKGLKKPAYWRYEPHVATAVFEEWLKEYPIKVIKNFKLDRGGGGVAKIERKIQSIKSVEGLRISGKVFIDATIEGDLLAASGVSTVVGREANRLYKEEKNGIRPLSSRDKFKVKIDPYNIKGDLVSGLLPGIEKITSLPEGEADSRIQAYCYRICLTKEPSNRLAIPKPANYQRERYELYLRYMENGGKLAVPNSNIPNGKIDFNGGADLSHNLYGGHYEYPNGSYQKRDSIVKAYQDYTMGLLYFFSNDTAVARVAPWFQKGWQKIGLAKDEFTDNGGWPRLFYVRDGRRMVSDYIITEHHIKKNGAIAVDDPVALSYWPPDLHAVRRVMFNGELYNEGAVFGGDWWKPFGISYKSMVPARNQVLNLITPTCISASHVAYGAVRIEWTFMAMGQAAGIAASIAGNSGVPVQDVAYSQLSQLLQNKGAVLQLPAPVKEFNVRSGLPFFFKKIRENKKVRIGFIGGSITRAEDQYRQQTLQLLKDRFPRTEFEEVVAAIPGTDADLGVFRVDEQLISKHPDLVFIEFAVNGGHAKGVEGIVRKIWKQLPSTDICLIYTATAAQVNSYYTFGNIPPHIKGLEQIANHYAIPSIHLGFRISSLMQEGKMSGVLNKSAAQSIPAFTKDGVHPTREGGNEYALTIDAAFSQWQDSGIASASSRLKEALDTDNWENAVALDPASFKKIRGWKTSKVPYPFEYIGKGKWVNSLFAAEDSKSYIRFEFEGTQLGIFDIGGPEVGQLEVIIDGNSSKFNRFNKYCNNRYRGQYFLMDVPPGRHIIELKVASDIPDKKQILGVNQLADINKNPGKYNRSFIYLGKILVRGNVF